MRWKGKITFLASLGDYLIVYGGGGVTALKSFTDPVPTFGEVHTWRVEVSSRGAVGVSESKHIFVDSHGWLYKMTEREGIARLGFREYLSQLKYVDIVISYDAEEQVFYISDDDYCFCLTDDDKLFEVTTVVAGLSRYRGKLFGVYDYRGDPDCYFLTDRIDMNFTEAKLLSSVEIKTRSSQECYVQVSYTMRRGGEMITAPSVPLNEDGWARVQVSGVEFQISFAGVQGTQVDSIIAKWQPLKLSNTRGDYVNQTNT